MRQPLLYALFTLMVLLNPVQASDTAKEKRWADQIVDTLLVGEAVWLEVGTDKVLGIFAEHTTDEAKGAAIILHGIGAHPDWPDIINPLRSQLPEHGWMTLSLQLPILENDATTEQYEPLFSEVAPRINAAVQYLKKKGVRNIVIIAHSLGAAMSTHYLADKPDPAVRAFVGIGMNQSKIASMDNAGNLQKIKIPVLDIYGSRDLEGVLASVDKRAQAAKKAGNQAYQQLRVEGADHFFNGQIDTLRKRIRGWLEQNAAGTESKQ